MIDEIIKREWDFFQEVHNIGGRASCQDDFETFYLQRSSQFKVFNDELNKSYLNDLIKAKECGRNLIYEKYAYMMESTDNDYFQSIKKSLPVIDNFTIEMINTICQIEVEMRKEFQKQYPKLFALSRHTTSQEDERDDTSFETYLRGELMTYSINTIILYAEMIVDMMNNNRNIVLETMKYTAEAYGYQSIEDAEEKAKL
jgi:hypothetical protein